MKKPKTKKELVSLMQISPRTLSLYLNKKWFEELKTVGYHKNLRILSPKMVEVICDKWGEID